MRTFVKLVGFGLLMFSIYNPTSLWEFFLSFMVMAIGYKMFSTGRIPML